MNDRYGFKPNEVTRIVQRFGLDFYEKALRDLDTFSDKWSLSRLRLIPSYSANLVVKCHSDLFGSAVLKIGNPAQIATEYGTLLEYNGGRFCTVFAADPERGVLLEEQVQPGKSLRDEESLHKRLAVFCSLYQGLHKMPSESGAFPAYTEWVSRITDYMSKQELYKELYLHMKQAKDICLSVSSAFSQTMLLHGDFHHDNIILCGHETYKIIDPKGVLGDPVFDVPRFILNEYEDEKNSELHRKIADIIAILEKTLHIPNEILKKCLYVETAMGVCWRIEDGIAPGEYSSLLEDIAFVEAIMNT